MSDEKKIKNNKDMNLADLESYRTGEEKEVSGITPEDSRVLDDLDLISKLFSDAKPEAENISETVDDIILGHIKQKSREIRRERKVVRLFPRYKWAAAAVMGVLVCAVSYNVFYKNEQPLDNSFKYNTNPALVKLSEESKGKEKPAVRNEQTLNPRLTSVDSTQNKLKLKREIVNSQAKIVTDKRLETIPDMMTEDIDGNGSINIIDAYLMNRRLMSGVVMPKNMDLNGDGNINREDVNSIAKTAVSLGRGEV